MNEPTPSAHPRFFQPVTLLAGVALGLLALAWAGRAVTHRAWHRDFVRFHPMIAPESMYEPTIAEMRAIVRAQCRPDQVLVIVGGNSIFQGVGQPVEKLWTRRLQELLGDRYAVVNLAFRGSSPTDGGALVAESLRDEFPRQIYLANALPFTAASAAGSLDYRFMLFDAHYKGWLLDFPPREAIIQDYLAHPGVYPAARELSLGARLDAWLRFRDFWNWVAVTRLFTFPTPISPGFKQAFLARREFPDREPDFEAIPARHRFQEKYIPIEMEITRNTSAIYYEKDPAGSWRLIEPRVASFISFSQQAFPAPLKARTLIVLCPNAPFYVRRLTPDEKARDALAMQDSLAQWRAMGYEATTYGAGFTDADFGDRTHLAASGGQKLAEEIAPQIRLIADKLGHLKN